MAKVNAAALQADCSRRDSPLSYNQEEQAAQEICWDRRSGKEEVGIEEDLNYTSSIAARRYV